jgi:hypothetical protein
VQADLESGIWACADRPGTNPKALPQTSTFVTGMVKGFGDVAPYGRWQIKAGNAQQGPLATEFDGPRPAQGVKRAPYYPMRLQGSIILGIGGALLHYFVCLPTRSLLLRSLSRATLSGDNSDGATGVFMEGVMLKGASTDAADDAVQADLNSFYSKVSLL